MRPLYIASLLLILFACQSSNTSSGVDNWIEANAHQDISDYDYQNIINEAKLIGIGESRHDLEEQIEARIQITKDLILQSGKVEAIIFEGSLPYGRYINDYVLGAEDENIEEIMTNMPGWFLWDTQGYLEFFKWLRNYNDSHDLKIEVYGADIVAPRVGLNQVKSYLIAANIDGADSIVNAYYGEEHMVDEMWMTTMRNFRNHSDTLREALLKPYEDLMLFIDTNRGKLIKTSSKSEYELIRLIAKSTVEAKNMFLASSQLETGLIRDRAMANVASKLVRDKQLSILWAHNVHVTKGPFTMSMLPEDTIKGMGYLLHQEMGEAYKVIGGTFGTGYFESDNRALEKLSTDLLEGKLDEILTDDAIFNLPIPANDSIASTYFEKVHSLRGQEFEMTLIPAESFDALYFTKTVTKAKYRPITEERLSGM